MSEARENCPTCPNTELPCAMDGHSCMTSPNYPAGYDTRQTCSIDILSNGTITALNFSTNPGDWLSIGESGYSGTVGPVGMPVQTGSTIGWQSLSVGKDKGWRLCWSSSSSEPTMTQSLEVLSLARNSITGNTDNLEQQSALKTLLISSNYLSCQSAKLENTIDLGQGVFQDPTSSALEQAGKVILHETEINPFTSVPKTFKNTVLAYAGNTKVPGSNCC